MVLLMFRDLDLKIKAGDFIFVTGPSGSGKSTLIKMILNQVKPSSGHVIIDGQNLAKLRIKRN